MKKLFLFATLIVASIFAVTSCGGSSDDKNKEQAETQDGVATLDDQLDALGALDGYVELEKGVYKINAVRENGEPLSINFNLPIKVVQPMDTNSVHVKVALLDADKNVIKIVQADGDSEEMLTNALKKQGRTVNLRFEELFGVDENNWNKAANAKYVIISETKAF